MILSPGKLAEDIRDDKQRQQNPKNNFSRFSHDSP
jgi:hypothetical protein